MSTHPDKVRASVARYQASEKGKATVAAYNRSEARRISVNKYNASQAHAESVRRYLRTDKVKAVRARAEQNPKAKLARSLRDRIRKILKRGNGKRPGSAVRDLGCSLDAFKSHIEIGLLPGMSWDNYGEWHLDHIKPLRMFDLTDRAQFLQACHFTNYQPLWARDNLRKAGKFAEAA